MHSVVITGEHSLGREAVTAIVRESAITSSWQDEIFNQGSVRDYQFKSPQWTIGKNFDDTGACGPWFVSADELPPGASGLKIEMVLNSKVEQSASTADLMFPVARLCYILGDRRPPHS